MRLQLVPQTFDHELHFSALRLQLRYDFILVVSEIGELFLVAHVQVGKLLLVNVQQIRDPLFIAANLADKISQVFLIHLNLFLIPALDLLLVIAVQFQALGLFEIGLLHLIRHYIDLPLLFQNVFGIVFPHLFQLIPSELVGAVQLLQLVLQLFNVSILGFDHCLFLVFVIQNQFL